jgi:predicted metal-binding membrane protein
VTRPRGRSPLAGRAAIALAWRPEWPLAILALLAWTTIVMGALPYPHAQHHPAAPDAPSSFVPMLAGWTVMCVAMMMPLTLPAVRYVALNSIRARRVRAMAVYTAAYLGVWVAFGALALLAAAPVRRHGFAPEALVPAVFLLAALWQLTPAKRRAVIGCRRTTPLAPAGWRADRACARFGLAQGWRCVVSCWPLMLLMAVNAHSLPLMAGLAGLLAVEKLRVTRAATLARLAAPLALAGICSAVW